MTTLPRAPVAPSCRGRKSLTATLAWQEISPADCDACGAILPTTRPQIIAYKIDNLGASTVLVFEGGAAERTAVETAGGTVGGVPVPPNAGVAIQLNGRPVSALSVKTTAGEAAIEVLVGLVE